MGRQITNEEFLQKNAEYFKINDLTPLEEYKKARQKILFKHNKCGFQFYGRSQDIIENTLNCPICNNKFHKKTPWEFKQFIEMKYSNVVVQSDFVNSKTPVKLYCKQCGNTWNAKPSTFAHNKKKKYCPFCSKQKIGPPPDYMNSIWASEYRDYASQFLDEETQKTMSPFSTHKVLVTCPNCGNKKLISLSHLFRDGIRCFCEDGISYLKRCMADVGKTDYFKKRGLTDETIKKFCLGYDVDKRVVTIPYSSKLQYYQTRSVEDKRFFKPRTEDAGAEPIYCEELLNVAAKELCFVVESPICAMSIMQESNQRAVAICGVKEKISVGKYDYMVSSIDENGCYLRRLSNTNNANVIFSISLKREQDLCDLKEFGEKIG